jgi:hypothetical protein
MGFKESDIIVDTLTLSPNDIEVISAERKKSLGMLMRYLEINKYLEGADTIERARHTFPEVNFRYTVIPKETLPSGRLPISFKTSQIEEMFKLGKQDALEVIQLGEQVNTMLYVEHANHVRYDLY